MAKKQLSKMDRDGMFYVLNRWSTTIYEVVGGGIYEYHKILVDPETRVMYHATNVITSINSSTNCSRTCNVLLNPDGSPRVYDDPIE